MKSFRSFRLDTANQCLWRGQERVPIAPKAYDVLRYLVENPGRLVTPDEILEKLWSEIYVNPEVLRKYILDIRKILGDRPDKPEFIETVTKRGYRFIATVIDESATPPPDSATQKEIALELAPSEEAKSAPGHYLSKVAIIPILGVVVTAAIAGHFWFARSSARSSLNANSIVVLPFADMSPAKDQEYFSDGLSEQLIHDLAKVPGLKVVGRSSAFQFRGKNEDLRDVGRKLGVSNVLEGSVRREGNRVRITAELVKADDGFQLWSQTYDREIKDIFAAQDEIARAVTGTLQVKLLSPNTPELSSSSRDTSPEAYEAYLQARYFIARGQDKRDLDAALSYADQAIKLDVNYAPAWAQRSRVLRVMAGVGPTESTEGFHRARESAAKAIALDPNLASGYLAMAMVQMNPGWDWQGAETSLKKAALLEPGSAAVLFNRAYLSRMLGRVEEAIELYRQAVALDPLRADFHLALGYELYLVGRYEEAQAALQRAQDLNPQLLSLHLARGQALFSEGRPQEALAEMENETGEWEKLSGEALAYYALGHREESEGSLKKLIATYQNNCAYQIAEVYAYRGEIDKAFEWLDRAYRQRDPGTPEMKSNPLMRNLRLDRRYAELLKKMHLPT
jgi:TolB-like protein/DNA-binding winged helix-turn-helix (wHTH) protein/Flp pilus assembly protein TadD